MATSRLRQEHRPGARDLLRGGADETTEWSSVSASGHAHLHAPGAAAFTMPAGQDRHPIGAASVITLQRSHGNAYVNWLLAPHGRPPKPIADDEQARAMPPTSIAPAGAPGSIVQRRIPGGGARAPVRQAPQLPRGRVGQLPGQRLPPRSTARRDAARREQFERREQQRFDAARRHFEEIVRRAQEFNEQWAREGSEPKTARERVFRAFVRFLEITDEVNSHWDKTHSAFETLNLKRDAYVNRLGLEAWPNLAKDQKDKAVQRLTEHLRDVNLINWELTVLDKDLAEATVSSGTKLEALEAERRAVTPTIANAGALYAANKQLRDHLMAFDRLRKEWISRLSRIQAKIDGATRRLQPIPIVQLPATPGRTTPDNTRVTE